MMLFCDLLIERPS